MLVIKLMNDLVWPLPVIPMLFHFSEARKELGSDMWEPWRQRVVCVSTVHKRLCFICLFFPLFFIRAHCNAVSHPGLCALWPVTMCTQCDNLQLQGCYSSNEMPLGPERANAELQQHNSVVMHKDTGAGICSIADAVVEWQLHFCMYGVLFLYGWGRGGVVH